MCRTVLLACCAGLLLAGCSVKVGTTGSLSRDTIEQGISDAVLNHVGHRPAAVDCPDSLEAKPGNSTRCVMTEKGARYGVTATITGIANGRADYHIQVDDEPLASGWFG